MVVADVKEMPVIIKERKEDIRKEGKNNFKISTERERKEQESEINT